MRNINIKKFVTMMIILVTFLSFPVQVSADASEPFVGEICLFAFNFTPKGWARCDGQIMPISQNTALFALLGTVYGGNGKTTFALPDLNGMNSSGASYGVPAQPWGENRGYYCIALQGVFPPRQ